MGLVEQVRHAWLDVTKHPVVSAVASLAISATSVVGASVFVAPNDVTLSKRVGLGLLGLVIGLAGSAALFILYAVIVTPYRQRNELHRKARELEAALSGDQDLDVEIEQVDPFEKRENPGLPPGPPPWHLVRVWVRNKGRGGSFRAKVTALRGFKSVIDGRPLPDPFWPIKWREADDREEYPLGTDEQQMLQIAWIGSPDEGSQSSLLVRHLGYNKIYPTLVSDLPLVAVRVVLWNVEDSSRYRSAWVAYGYDRSQSSWVTRVSNDEPDLTHS